MANELGLLPLDEAAVKCNEYKPVESTIQNLVLLFCILFKTAGENG